MDQVNEVNERAARARFADSGRTTRARIRDAAIARFATDGVAAENLKMIAADAGVSSASLVIYHFGSKEGLRVACDEYVAGAILTGKRNICLDLWKPAAREVASRLCDRADVIVENFRAGTLRAFGLDYRSVALRNPRVVYASLTGYGQDGPWQAGSAYAPTVQAEAGMTANSIRHYGRHAARWQTDPLSHADVYAGLHGVVAILAALHERERTGQGQHVDVAMAAVVVSVNERVHADLSGEFLGAEPAALGATDCPFFETADGEQVVLATSLVGSLTFELYLRAMRRPDLADDPRFATPDARAQHLDELHALVQTWIHTFSNRSALEAQLEEAKIAVGAVRDVRDFAATEWAAHWPVLVDVDDRHGGTYRVPGRPWRFSGTQPPAPGVPAFQGEHNREVLRELGYTAREIDRLEALGASSQPSPARRTEPRMHEITLRYTLNGRAVDATVEARRLLVHHIREDQRLTGTHIGCDTSQCGACTILVDGVATKSCTVLAAQVDGRDVLTIEGLASADGELHPMQQAFLDRHGLQCGYCTPGMVLTALDLAARHRGELTETSVRHGLHGNLCRCTGYDFIVDSVLDGAARLAAETGDDR